METNIKETLSKLSALTDSLKQIQIPQLKPKSSKESKKLKNKVTLTEGAMVIVQFKTIQDAEKYYNTL